MLRLRLRLESRLKLYHVSNWYFIYVGGRLVNYPICFLNLGLPTCERTHINLIFWLNDDIICFMVLC